MPTTTVPTARRAARRALASLAALGATVLLAAAALATPSASSPEPTFVVRDVAPFEAVYEVGNDLLVAGTARLALAREDGGWRYTLTTRPRGVFKLTGKGRIRESSLIDLVPADAGRWMLRPRSYSYRQDDEKRRSIDASFDWSGGRLEWQRRGESEEAPLDTPLFDRLSVTLVLREALRESFETLELEVFDNGRIKTMRFVNEGRERIETPMGSFETLRVRGQNAAGSSRSSLTWFAPALDHLPVRLEQRKRGDLVARMNLTRLRASEAEVALEPNAD